MHVTACPRGWNAGPASARALPQSSPDGRGRSCQPLRKGPALQLRGAGVHACVRVRVRVRVHVCPARAHSASRPSRPSLLFAAVPRPRPFPPPLPLLPGAAASPPPSHSPGEFAQQPWGQEELRKGAAETGGEGRGQERMASDRFHRFLAASSLVPTQSSLPGHRDGQKARGPIPRGCPSSPLCPWRCAAVSFHPPHCYYLSGR